MRVQVLRGGHRLPQHQSDQLTVSTARVPAHRVGRHSALDSPDPQTSSPSSGVSPSSTASSRHVSWSSISSSSSPRSCSTLSSASLRTRIRSPASWMRNGRRPPAHRQAAVTSPRTGRPSSSVRHPVMASRHPRSAIDERHQDLPTGDLGQGRWNVATMRAPTEPLLVGPGRTSARAGGSVLWVTNDEAPGAFVIRRFYKERCDPLLLARRATPSSAHAGQATAAAHLLGSEVWLSPAASRDVFPGVLEQFRLSGECRWSVTFFAEAKRRDRLRHLLRSTLRKDTLHPGRGGSGSPDASSLSS